VRFIGGYTGSSRGGGVTAAVWANDIVTVTTATPHGLGTGEYVVIAGMTPAGYNGTFEVAVLNATQFTYTLAVNPGSAATVLGTVSDLGVPDEALGAVLLLAAHFYENREATIVTDRRITVEEMPIGYDDLISTLRVPYVS